jgi:cyclophilin family peptidyl-prolyl cis-trans isomerase
MATDTTAPNPPALWPEGTWTTKPQVTMQTSKGAVVYLLEPNAAPYSVVNFLAYVNTGFYNGLVFHRVISDFVVQGGGYKADLSQKFPLYGPISLESGRGLSNLRGTIAMARTSDPNSATSEFYVNLVNNASSLDYKSLADPGYAVFGKVISGLSVIDAIGRVSTGPKNGLEDVPTSTVSITSARETTLGAIFSKTGKVLVGGLEGLSTTYWQYTTDGGANWIKGSGGSFTLAAGGYEGKDILIRQIDKAGNVGKPGRPGADIVVNKVAAIMGNSAANTLSGTSANNAMYGLGGNDILNGGAGNDSLDGGSGIDTMNGGTGNDVFDVRNSGDRVVESITGNTDTVRSFITAYTLAANVEYGRIMSKATAALTGNTLNNVLYAGAGNNALNGGSGTDTVSYAFGLVGTTGVTVSLALTSAQTTVGSGRDTLTSIENLTGSASADKLTGNSSANVLDGGAGIDTMTGGDGNDSYLVRQAGDLVRETNATESSGGTDLVYSYLASYTLTANVENGRIMLATAANLTGNSLNNLLDAGAGNNVLAGGEGTDTVSYALASAAVTVSLASAGAQATGGSGSDTLSSIENLTGSGFADNLSGNSGVNVLTGGAGADVFVFSAALDSPAATPDVITDFTTGDKIDLSLIDADSGTLSDDAFSATLVSDFTAAGQLKLLDGVLFGNTDSDLVTAEFAIALTGVTSLTSGDFIL